MHIFHTLPVLSTCGYYIYPCRADAAVSQYISKSGYIFSDVVEHSCKQMSQIMGEYFSRFHVCFLAQRLHFTPYVRPVHRPPRPCDKDTPMLYIFCRRITQQFPLQLFYDKNSPCFTFAANHGFSSLYSFHCYIFQLADTDTCPAYSLQYQRQPFVMSSFCRPALPCIFIPGEFLFF